MKSLMLSGAALALSMAFAPAPATRTFIGHITDTMCGASHAAMKVTPDAKCVRDCVKQGSTHTFALYDGSTLYKLTDQQAPARLAGQKVKVTGVLYERTGTIAVEKIEPAK